MIFFLTKTVSRNRLNTLVMNFLEYMFTRATTILTKELYVIFLFFKFQTRVGKDITLEKHKILIFRPINILLVHL